ncbi:hypothetical protein LQ567_25825 [Niabella pedocola]|uniref:Outer membrane assembly protein n=1 Tax=Niabella pedocola TaxID=1752077 RepID=A0ABS8Q1Z2_9BACT|nr:hypothetical protein [Niabella pedocola]MCD2426231.1 hypothetical protein [Niabella pedocola]
MRYITGILATAVILCITAYLTLSVWGINPVDPAHLRKALITLGILLAAAFLLIILVPFFFKNHSKGYQQNGGNVAQPRQR